MVDRRKRFQYCLKPNCPENSCTIDPFKVIQERLILEILVSVLHFKPVLEVTTCYLQGEDGVEIRIESVNKDNSHSWVRISHGLNKLVTDLIDKKYDDNEQETSETKTETIAFKTDVFAFASRSKVKAKPRIPTSACSSTRTVPIRERSWTDIEPETFSPIAYPVSKRLSTLLRHGDLPREEDGAIEFWRSKDGLRNEFEHSQYWSDRK